MTKAAKPKVSIGLPVYNGELYLEDALNSLVNQTFEDIEIIISDNASEDGTSEICRRYASRDPRIRYHRNERNLGAGPNFNRTFELARGEYFKWAAHDDLLEPSYLEKCIAALDADHAAVLAHSEIAQIDESGHRIGCIHRPLLGADHRSAHRRFAQAILTDHSCRDVFGLIRTSALENMPLHEGRLDTDRTILAELALRGRFLHVPEPLFVHRDHPKRYVHTSHGDRDARTAWYDPSRTSDRLGHYAELYSSYFAAVWRSAPTLSSRLACLGHLLRWAMIDRNLFALLADQCDMLDPRIRVTYRRVKGFLPGRRRDARSRSKQVPQG